MWEGIDHRHSLIQQPVELSVAVWADKINNLAVILAEIAAE